MDLKKIFHILSKKGTIAQSILIESKNIDLAYENAIYLSSQILNQKEINRDYPDLFLLNPEKNIKIEEIKLIQDFCYLTPQSGKNKVVLINKAEKLTIEAANAILKILEEPVKNRYFILTTANRNKLLSTIVSRCVIFSVREKSNELENYKNKVSSDSYKNSVNFFKNILNIKKLSYFDILNFLENLYKELDNIEDFLKFIILINNLLIDTSKEKKEIILRIKLIEYFLNIFEMLKININNKNILNLITIYLKKGVC